MYGPVPHEYERISPIMSYEYVLTGVEEDRQRLIVDRLVNYLERYGSEFDTIVGYATSKTYRTVIERAFEKYGAGTILPRDPEMRTLTEHFRTTNLQELTELLERELSSSTRQ